MLAVPVWTEPVTVSPPAAGRISGYDARIGQDGATILAWGVGQQVLVRVRPRDGRFGPIRGIAAGGVVGEVDLGPASVAWSTTGEGGKVAVAPLAGGPARTLEAAPGVVDGLDLDESGSTLAWRRTAGGRIAVRTATGDEPVRELDEMPVPTAGGNAVHDASGMPVVAGDRVAWISVTGVGRDCCQQVRVSGGPPLTSEEPFDWTGRFGRPSPASAPGVPPLLAWAERTDWRTFRVMASDGSGAPAQIASGEGYRPGRVLAALQADGSAALAWQDGISFECGADHLVVARRAAGAGFGPPSRIPSSRYPRLDAVIPVGDGFLMAWQRRRHHLERGLSEAAQCNPIAVAQTVGHLGPATVTRDLPAQRYGGPVVLAAAAGRAVAVSRRYGTIDDRLVVNAAGSRPPLVYPDAREPLMRDVFVSHRLESHYPLKFSFSLAERATLRANLLRDGTPIARLRRRVGPGRVHASLLPGGVRRRGHDYRVVLRTVDTAGNRSGFEKYLP